MPESFRNAGAYRDSPLPIGSGQTISQPYIVALMTDLADAGPDSIVLEIGTGSGYQAAVLAEFVDHVYTIEIIEELGRRAAETLERLDYGNVSVKIGDGYQGWPEFCALRCDPGHCRTGNDPRTADRAAEAGWTNGDSRGS